MQIAELPISQFAIVISVISVSSVVKFLVCYTIKP